MKLGFFFFAGILVIVLVFFVTSFSLDPELEYLDPLDTIRVIGTAVVAGFIVGFIVSGKIKSGILLGYLCILFAAYSAYMITNTSFESPTLIAFLD
jgi:uncharacterized protein YebE (UPF0316 family)